MDARDRLPASVRPLVARLAAAAGVRRVVLYGSRARGDHRERSDVDLALGGLRLRLDADEARTLYHVDLLCLDALGRALDRLDEALAVPQDAPLAVDGTIQRFESTFELCWKALKDGLLVAGVEVLSPLESLRRAFQIGWIDDEVAWIQMLKDRNLSSHTYREEEAAEIYGRIRTNAPRLREAYDVLTGLA